MSSIAHRLDIQGLLRANVRYAKSILDIAEKDLLLTETKNAEPYEHQQHIKVEVKALTSTGVGIAYDNGRPIHIPFALPGETVEAKVWRNEDDHSKADLVSVFKQSPQRVDPQCSLFGECAGCQLQHLDYERQLAWKTSVVADLFAETSNAPEVTTTIGSPRLWGYRSKITPHFKKPRPDKPLNIGFTNFYRRGQIMDVAQCPIATDQINEALPAARNDVAEKAGSYKKGATLLLRQHDNGVETNPRAIVQETVNDVTFFFKAGEFFQNNPHILPLFVDYIESQATAGTEQFLLDAYCGSGLLALSLASSFVDVTGIEISSAAIEMAQKAATHNTIDNARFIAASAENLFAEINYAAAQTTLVLDPPRKGCSEDFLKQVNQFAPQRIIYVSCNPETQARDIDFLTDQYEIIAIQPFDLFPHTKHVECVVTLTRKDI